MRPLVVAAVVLGAIGACTYSPDFANDKLVCGPGGTCPKGYSCASIDNKCWKTGETPGGGSGGADGGTHPDAGGTGGVKMDASSDVPISNDPRTGFVGTWTFTGGTLSGSCSDGSTLQRPLSGTTNDYIVISLGTMTSTVLAQWYCQTGWTMQLSSGNTMAVATSNQSCVQRTTDNSTPPVTTTYTWSPVMFSFTKLTATTAMSTGHLAGPFTDSNNVMGTCDLTFSGPLSKN